MKFTRRSFVAASGASLLSAAAHTQPGARTLHRCGMLEMRIASGGQVHMYGWQDLVPNDRPAIGPGSAARYVITSSFSDKILEVHDRGTTRDYVPRAIWPVITPDASELPGTVHGSVYSVETQPDWNPSASLRRKYQVYRQEHPEEDLPPLPAGTVPYGHPANPMGKRKIRANWRGRYAASAVVHGTSGYPVELCSAETSGCVRLYDEWIIALVDDVLEGADHALTAGVECILTPHPIARRVSR